MKTRRLLLLLLAVAHHALAAGPDQVADPIDAPVELTVYYYERQPFFGDIDGQPAGRLIDVARLILDAAEVRYQLVNIPVVRFFETLKKPGNACLLGALRTREREAIYTYSDDFIYRDEAYRIIVNRNQRGKLPERPSVAQILGSRLRLGVAEGYSYGEWLDGKLAEHRPPTTRINIGNQSEKMHQMIVAGRFDYMFSVAEEARFVVARTRANRESLTSVEIVDAPRGNMRYLLCSRGIDAALMRRINLAIGRVKASLSYEQAVAAP